MSRKLVAVLLIPSPPVRHWSRQESARRFGDRLELSMTLPKTLSGMEVRYCPREECAPRLFRLGEVRDLAEIDTRAAPLMHRQPHSAGTTCPYCGRDSDDGHDFVDSRDIEALTEWFKWAAQEDVSDAVTDMFKNVGRGFPQGGLISLKVTTNRRSRPEPPIWRQDLLRDLTCTVCGRRYGVYAIALFCPDCGTPNLNVHSRRECELIEQQIALAREADSPELSFRLLGNAHEDVVTALETYLKTVYRYVAGKRLPAVEAARLSSAKSSGNAFQNIERA